MIRYYVKQGPNDQIEGPYGIEQLRYRLWSGQMGPDAMAVLSTGQSLGQLRAARDWKGVEAVMADYPAEGPESAPEAIPPADAPPVATAAPRTAEENHRILMWLLFVISLVLLLFGDALAGALVSMFVPGLSVNGITVRLGEPDLRLALSFRIVGVLLFLAGLVERVLLALVTRGEDGE